MKIYTRTGDEGHTSLFGGRRVAKDDARVAAYGDVDELNAWVGLCRLECEARHSPIEHMLKNIQGWLFTVGAVLATPHDSKSKAHVHPIQPIWTTSLERAIDEADEQLAPLTTFVLPGGGRLAAQLHVARVVCRRAERAAVSLAKLEPVPPEVVTLLNRLSDYLFTAARLANHLSGVGDVPWTQD